MADKKRRRPNLVQTAFSDFFRDVNVVREEVVTNPVKKVMSINNYIQSKLS